MAPCTHVPLLLGLGHLEYCASDTIVEQSLRSTDEQVSLQICWRWKGLRTRLSSKKESTSCRGWFFWGKNSDRCWAGSGLWYLFDPHMLFQLAFPRSDLYPDTFGSSKPFCRREITFHPEGGSFEHVLHTALPQNRRIQVVAVEII